MSTVRSGLLSKSESEVQKDDENIVVVPLSQRKSFEKLISEDGELKLFDGVSRWKFDNKLAEGV